MPKPAKTTGAKKAVAKTAQRAKVTEARVPCPECGEHMRPVHFYPEKGHPINARGCAKCRKVYGTATWAVLALEVAGL